MHVLLKSLTFVLFLGLKWGFAQDFPTQGKASYYSKTFKGKSTASGETYDPNDYTCAHKSLPFGTYIRVKRGNRSTLVRVIDRGPHIKGRIVDLSYAAAQEIGLDRAGVGEVTIEIVDINTLPIHQSN